MTQIIEITIAPDSQTKVETKGFTGHTCQQASRFLEEALGKRIGEQLTAEFHNTQPRTTIDQRQH